MEIRTCAYCGCVIEDGEEFVERELSDGTTVILCGDCKEEENFVRCRECGRVVRADEARFDPTDSTYVCEDCYDDGFNTCNRCGAIIPMGDSVVVNPGTRHETVWCEDCADRHAYTCEDCNDVFESQYMHMDDCGTYVCGYCFDDHWYACEDCGRLINGDAGEVYWGGYGEDTPYCEYCYDQHQGSDLVMNYSFKPDPVFSRTDKDGASELTLGVELEIDKGDDQRGCAQELADLTGLLYMKHDGSLSDETVGIEIVTHPCTLHFHEEEFPWAKICEIALRYGYRSHDARTCGLHVHVGRKQLGDDHVAARAAVLVDKLWPVLSILSRRNGDNGWAHRPEVENLLRGSDTTEARAEAAVYDKLKRSGRYQAVNMQNYGTVEFRFNRGTLRKDTIIATIQMIYSLCMYAKQHTLIECIAASWDDVLNSYNFTELREYSEAKLGGEVNTEDMQTYASGVTFLTEEEYQTHLQRRIGALMHASNDVDLEQVRDRLPVEGSDTATFRFGDRVRVVDDARCPNRDVREGVILDDSNPAMIGVYFPGILEGHEGNNLPHRLNRAFGLNLPANGGSGMWWISPDGLEHVVVSEFHVGDVVLYNHIEGADRDAGNYRSDLMGVAGRVSDVNSYPDRIGVEWANELPYSENGGSGHNCRNTCPNGHGWYVRPVSLINLSR